MYYVWCGGTNVTISREACYKVKYKAEDKAVKWFVAKTRAKQERSVQRQIAQLGVETFLPTREEIREWHDRKKKVDAVLIPNTVFVHSDKQTAIGLHNEHGIQVSYLRDMTINTSLLEIPDYQMRNFIDFVSAAGSQYTVESEEVMYMKGDKVIFKKGPMKGIVGELVRVDGKDKVLVIVENIIACSVGATLDMLEKV